MMETNLPFFYHQKQHGFIACYYKIRNSTSFFNYNISNYYRSYHLFRINTKHAVIYLDHRYSKNIKQLGVMCMISVNGISSLILPSFEHLIFPNPRDVNYFKYYAKRLLLTSKMLIYYLRLNTKSKRLFLISDYYQRC